VVTPGAPKRVPLDKERRDKLRREATVIAKEDSDELINIDSDDINCKEAKRLRESYGPDSEWATNMRGLYQDLCGLRDDLKRFNDLTELQTGQQSLLRKDEARAQDMCTLAHSMIDIKGTVARAIQFNHDKILETSSSLPPST